MHLTYEVQAISVVETSHLAFAMLDPNRHWHTCLWSFLHAMCWPWSAAPNCVCYWRLII